METAFRALLTETVTHAAYAGQDGYGTPTYGKGHSRPARVQYTIRRIVNAQGQEVLSRCKVFLDSDASLTLKDRLTLADGTSPPLQLLSPVRDETGTLSHYEVWL